MFKNVSTKKDKPLSKAAERVEKLKKDSLGKSETVKRKNLRNDSRWCYGRQSSCERVRCHAGRYRMARDGYPNVF